MLMSFHLLPGKHRGSQRFGSRVAKAGVVCAEVAMPDDLQELTDGTTSLYPGWDSSKNYIDNGELTAQIEGQHGVPATLAWSWRHSRWCGVEGRELIDEDEGGEGARRGRYGGLWTVLHQLLSKCLYSYGGYELHFSTCVNLLRVERLQRKSIFPCRFEYLVARVCFFVRYIFLCEVIQAFFHYFHFLVPS